ncbi:MAG: hypothetical protein IT304_07190 [Dehalococcoidia bacterium]|nr:hypothetical protein [Dehalococcoidia bacterium]
MDYLDLYWLPVGAGTHVQRASLVLYESIAAAFARRRRSTLCHAGLEMGLGGRTFTLELTPVPAAQDVPAAMTGAVGSPLAGRLRLFRYQLVCREAPALPDAQWAVGEPRRLSADPAAIRRVMDLAHTVPARTWGRRADGTHEMWTSNSAVSWLLLEAGVPLRAAAIPAGVTAPGWQAGIDAWMAAGRGGVESPRMDITRAVSPGDLAPLLQRPPRATLAFVRDGAVEAMPVAFVYDAGRYLVGLASDDPPAGRVRLLVDDGPWYFDLRGAWVRGRLVPVGPPAGAVAAAAWFELEPEKTVAWHYGRMREA